jgi:hypothetical protein
MKSTAASLFFLIALLSGWGDTACGQSFTFVPQEISLAETLGAEMVFHASCTNLAAIPLTLRFIRTVNALPGQWESSMCLDVCYQSTVDTVVTTAEYGSSPLAPGEVRDFSLHVYAIGTPGTGYIRILVMDVRNTSDSLGVLFTADGFTSDVGELPEMASGLRLEQNYPNPFNGETRIEYRVPGMGKGGWVAVKVYDILGREVATLVDTYQPPGEYALNFDARALPSGVYFCRLGAGRLQDTRRLIILR